MTGLPLILAGAAVLAAAFAFLVIRSERVGVGVVAREFNGELYFFDTQVMDPQWFQPGAEDDRPRSLYALDHFLVTSEYLRRGTAFLVAPTSFVKITGL